jgi:hypothetical protein
MYISIYKVGVNRLGHSYGECSCLDVMDGTTLKKSLAHPFWQPYYKHDSCMYMSIEFLLIMQSLPSSRI